MAVKPGQIGAVAAEIGAVLGSIDGRLIVVSVAAGIKAASIENRLPSGTPVVRAMPNTPMSVGAAVTAIAPGVSVTEDELDTVDSIFEAVGEVLRVDEAELDAVTAVSGSGPAYVFLVAEAMIQAAMSLGLEREAAYRLVLGTLAGASAMLASGEGSPAVLRAQVTSPAGTTAAALEVLERELPSAFLRAIRAARDRAIELSSRPGGS